MIRPAEEVVFGAQGNAGPLAGEGWSFPEDGFAWSLGPRARLRVMAPAAPACGALALELALHAFTAPGRLDAQRLVLRANGVTLGETAVSGPAVLGFLLPAHMAGGPLDIALEAPCAAAPASLGVNPDTRRLGFAVRALRLWPAPRLAAGAGPTLPPAQVPAEGDLARALVSGFESLGHNCEFGFMQRFAGAETLSLLRFTGIALNDLLRGLETGFAGVGDPENFGFHTAKLDGRDEYMVRARAYEARFHTHLFTDDTADLDFVAARTAKYLQVLQRQFAASLREAPRIFVVYGPDARDMAHVLPVLCRLRAWGPGTLLYVTESESVPAGSVRREGDGLLHGFIDRFAPLNEARRLNYAAWLSICAGARALFRDEIIACPVPAPVA